MTTESINTLVSVRDELPERYSGSLLAERIKAIDRAIAAMKAKSDAEVVWPSCQTCGGKTVCIRGRYPDQPGREVCPTCLAERMDTIREVADRDYGRAYQAAPSDLAKKIGEPK